MELKYTEILQRNAALSRNLTGESCEIAILSNVVVSQAKEILEYALRVAKVPATVVAGDYDNIVQDSLKFRDANVVIIFWEIFNIVDGFQFKIELYDDKKIEEVFERIISEINFVFNNLENTSLVLFNAFTSILFSGMVAGGTNLDRLTSRLNQHLKDNAPDNVKIVDLERVIAHVGVHASIDLRYFYSSKAPYTIEFLKAYSRHIKTYVLSANGKSKKVIIFDCDNTLWKGVLGEAGYDGIEMSSATRDGGIFAEVQSIALSLNMKGVLIGLCSKNNTGDVDEVIDSHPDMQLRDAQIAVRKVNWSDKITNLREMAQELNLGLDSFVMVDDSPFEANLIKEQLPDVTVLQVPEILYTYPRMLRENLGLFYCLSSTEEDANKSEMYKGQEKRQISKREFSDIKSYLASLGMKIAVYQDEKSIIPRMAQLSQKTNQFNLTTRRYTERDIENFLQDERAKVFAFSVRDKFGDNGITGLSIVRIPGDNTAFIDSFLMSCRIIGRNVEFAFMDYLISQLRNLKIDRVSAQYIKTPKNMQVMEFFDGCSFLLDGSYEGEKNYSLNIRDYKSKQIDYMEIIDGRSN